MGFNTGNTVRRKPKTKAQQEREERIRKQRPANHNRRGRKRKVDEINKLK